MFNAHGSLATSEVVTSGYRAALAVSAGASVLGALAAVGIRRAPASDTGQKVEVEPVDPVVGELTPIGPK